MRLCLLIGVFAALVPVSAARAQVTYFPPGILDDTAKDSQFKEQWYSEQLRALREPSLWESSKNQTIQSYRFLYLRSFHHPISVRLDVNGDGTGLLVTKITTGRGGYTPGRLAVDKKRRLTKQQTDWFLYTVDANAFWSLPAFESPKKHIGPNGEEIVTVNLDGAQWIFEGAKNGKYHVSDRWSPKDGPVHGLGTIMMFDLAKLKLLYPEVY
jgi:hypothetical protein